MIQIPKFLTLTENFAKFSEQNVDKFLKNLQEPTQPTYRFFIGIIRIINIQIALIKLDNLQSGHIKLATPGLCVYFVTMNKEWLEIEVPSSQEGKSPYLVSVPPWTETIDDVVCDCPSYSNRGYCRHQREAFEQMEAQTEVSAREELEELAEAYRLADQNEKEAKITKEELRGPILELISEVVRNEIPLKTVTMKVPQTIMTDMYEDDFEFWRSRNAQDFLIIGMTSDGETITMELQEDPDLRKFEFVVGDYKFGRTTSWKAPDFDAKRFYEEQEELRDLVDVQEVTEYKVLDGEVGVLLAKNPELLDTIQKYISPSQPSVKLLPIRPIVEE